MKRALASKKKGNVNLAFHERNGYREIERLENRTDRTNWAF